MSSSTVFKKVAQSWIIQEFKQSALHEKVRWVCMKQSNHEVSY